jgi:CheY-like chemotaxis protein
MPGRETKETSILLVDDSPDFLKVASRFLRLLPGLSVAGVADGGYAALTQAAALKPDLVLIDLNMDDLSGLEAIPRLRALLPEARIIALTMMEASSHRQAALDAGADEFVTKARMETDLLPSIEQVMQSPRTAAEPDLSGLFKSSRPQQQVSEIKEPDAGADQQQ